jgi:hypothetical protein
MAPHSRASGWAIFPRKSENFTSPVRVIPSAALGTPVLGLEYSAIPEGLPANLPYSASTALTDTCPVDGIGMKLPLL